MFNNQTEEEEEKEVIFERERERDNKEYWCALRKHLVINQFQLQKLQTKSSCFLVWFAMVQVMLSLWSLFIEFLGSYTRCRVTTNFSLKIWVNLLTIRMLLCSLDEHQNVVVFFIRMLMVIRIFIWVHHWWIY